MRHKFAFRILDTVRSNILERLKILALNGTYRPSNDFKPYTVQVYPLHGPEPALIDFLDYHMSKFFSLDGHIETNIAKMFPRSYVPEHSDYIANTYGSKQDEIIKFQVPLITNSGAGLMWPFDEALQEQAEAVHLKEGAIYMFDNARPHSSVNFGDADRYWLTSRWKASCLLDSSILE